MLNPAGISLTRALRVERGAVVSFVGGGGKTTSMFRLADELRSSGLRVVTTTTTHISKEQVHLAPVSVNIDNLGSLAARLDEHGHCLIVGAPDGKGRVHGATSDLIASVRARPDVDVVLVEADGSRSLPFKAPGEHEPVVPEVTTTLVPIAGLNAISRPLDEDHVHRSEIAAELAGAPLGRPVTAETMARVLSHPKGGAKLLPPGATFIPLLNRADTDAAVQQAAEITEILLRNPVVDTALICSMQHSRPVLEARTPVAGIVLAAGMSRRYGSVKQILPWADTTLVAHCTRMAIEAGLDPVIVVLGNEAEKVRQVMAELPVRFVYNPHFISGQSTSIRKGVDSLPSRTGAALFLFANQPMVSTGMIRTIVHAHRCTLAPACVPVCEGKHGNPVLFDRMLFHELCELSGDTGGQALLERYSNAIVSVPMEKGALININTPEDYERLR
jgi:molybdenum cofactor cytidylyltransferase